MKIIQVTAFYPPHIGGIENTAREISERLVKRGNLIQVFTSDIGTKKAKLLSTGSYKINYLKSYEVAHSPVMPSLLFELLKIPMDSVIHLHISQAFIPEIVYLVSKIRRIPYIAHLHADVVPSGKLGFLLPLYKKIFLKRVLKSASKIIVLTKEYRELVEKKYNISENMVVIPNGVDERYFSDRSSFPTEKINLLFVGRLTVEKNVPLLIEVVSLLRSKAVLHIVGNGQKKNEIEKLISNKKLKNVILHGRKTGKDLINFYKRADIFLLASDREGLPLVLLEAMASELPIVASNVRGIRELVGNTGILVDEATPKNFTRAIDDVIKDQKLRMLLSKRGKTKAQKHSWTKIVKRFENIYKEVRNES